MKALVLTGASGGIGSLVTRRMIAEGWIVFAAARDPASLGASEGLVPIELDLADPQSIESAVGAIERRLDGKGLSALVNCAGVIVDGPVELVTEAELRRQFDVNVIGPMTLTRLLLPSLRIEQGRIVNVGAISAHLVPPFYGAIAASKAAVASFSDALRLELKPFGVTVSLIEPGALKTAIFASSAQAQADMLSQMPPEVVALYRREMDAVHTAFAKAAADDPRVVADAIAQALTAKRPVRRAIIGKGARLLAMLGRLPTGLRDRLVASAMGLQVGNTARRFVRPGAAGRGREHAGHD